MHKSKQYASGKNMTPVSRFAGFCFYDVRGFFVVMLEDFFVGRFFVVALTDFFVAQSGKQLTCKY